jgi:molybdenum cofactor biosynthesis enzyme MoaA
VLTNGTVLKPEWLERLKRAEQGSAYSLEVRVSLDGPTPETNDPIRGDGVFERVMRGIEMLVEHGFLPILTMTRIWDEADDARVLDEFRRVLAFHGCTRPRLKILPRLQIGAEASRTSGYDPHDVVTEDMLRDYDTSQLICQHSRVVTNRGVWVCPILLDAPDARLGDSLDSANVAYPLRHSACYTCYQYGAICTNPSSKRV